MNRCHVTQRKEKISAVVRRNDVNSIQLPDTNKAAYSTTALVSVFQPSKEIRNAGH